MFWYAWSFLIGLSTFVLGNLGMLFLPFPRRKLWVILDYISDKLFIGGFIIMLCSLVAALLYGISLGVFGPEIFLTT